MGSGKSAVHNMRLLISFIAFFAIISKRTAMVYAEVDMEVMETSGKITNVHDASLTADGSFWDGGQSDVETFRNVSNGQSSGKLYGYDDYMSSLDQYYPNPYDQNAYDYGK